MSAREHSQHTVIVIPGRIRLPATKAKASSTLKWRLAISEQLATGACCCLWRNSRSHQGERKAGSCGRLRGDDSILGTSSHLTTPCGCSSGAPVPTGGGAVYPCPQDGTESSVTVSVHRTLPTAENTQSRLEKVRFSAHISCSQPGTQGPFGEFAHT